MVAKNLSKLIETSSAAWMSSKIEGVSLIPLNTDPNNRQGTFLMKINPGGRYPRHRHPAGEEMYLLKGEATVGSYHLKAGDFLFSPPASVHDVSTTDGCVFVQILAKPLQIVPDGTLEEIETIPEPSIPLPTGTAADLEPYDPSLRTIPSGGEEDEGA